MDHHVNEYFCKSSDESPKGNFHQVIALHENNTLTWNEVLAMNPGMPRGWYELAHLSTKDRIEFTRDYWVVKLPYRLHFQDFVYRFFNDLDNIGVYLTQQKFDDPFTATLVYSIKDDRGFFRGCQPASEQDILDLMRDFPGVIFPQDYIAFLKIHNGFAKTVDCTGILSTEKMKNVYSKVQDLLIQQDYPLEEVNRPSDPRNLIPFYESFGMPYYQCFWGDWYPNEEMGNVYLSANTGKISDVKGADMMSFPSFSDWLMFYLEQIS